MSKQRDVRLIVRKMMENPEYEGLTYSDILDIVYWSQFGFVYQVISSGDKKIFDSYDSVMLKYLGSFIAHPARIDACIKYNKNKELGKHSGELQSEE